MIENTKRISLLAQEVQKQEYRFPIFQIYMCKVCISQTIVHLQKMFLKKQLYKFVAHTFTLLLTPFASKLGNYLRHSKAFEIVCKWSIAVF